MTATTGWGYAPSTTTRIPELAVLGGRNGSGDQTPVSAVSRHVPPLGIDTSGWESNAPADRVTDA